MEFRVYVIVEIPVLDMKYELLLPIDRRIHNIIKILKKAIPELNEGFYKDNIPNLYNKTSGKIYGMNEIIEKTDIKMGTSLVLI